MSTEKRKIHLTAAELEMCKDGWMNRLRGSLLQGAKGGAGESVLASLQACEAALNLLDNLDPITPQAKGLAAKVGETPPKYLDQGGKEQRPLKGPDALPPGSGPGRATLPPPVKIDVKL